MYTFLPMVALGIVVGGLVNYLADVLPTQRRIERPICTQCGNRQSWPGYLLWPRKCPNCGLKRGTRTWFTELIFVMVTIWLWFDPPDRIGFSIGLLLLIYFAIVVVIDIEHRIILHPVSIAGAVVGTVVGTWMHGISATLIGGVAGFGIMFILYLGGNLFAQRIARLRSVQIDEVALGFGDVNLSGVLGLLIGWPGIMAGLIIAVLIGGFISLIYMIWMIVNRRYQAFTPIPYGPFLIAGGIVLLFFKDVLFF